jgi:hypothetical protein
MNIFFSEQICNVDKTKKPKLPLVKSVTKANLFYNYEIIVNKVYFLRMLGII